MLRKQRKLQLWRRFEYVILVILKFGEFLLWFSPRIINGLRSYIKHSRERFVRYPNTLKLVKKNSAAPRFFNHFSVFRYWMKHSSSCLIYHVSSQIEFLEAEKLGLGVDYGSLQQIRNISLPEWAFINIHNERGEFKYWWPYNFFASYHNYTTLPDYFSRIIYKDFSHSQISSGSGWRSCSTSAEPAKCTEHSSIQKSSA